MPGAASKAGPRGRGADPRLAAARRAAAALVRECRSALRGVRRVPASRALARLERLRLSFGPEAAREKRALVAHVVLGRLETPGALVRFHELLCFVRAYPDDLRLHALASRALAAFAHHHRRALARHARALTDSGIWTTPITYPFFAPTARWLAARCPADLAVDWPEFGKRARLEELLPLLAHPSESPGLDEYDLGVRDWIGRMKGARETDAAFVIRRFADLPASDALREVLYDAMDLPVRLQGPGMPSRTRAVLPWRRVRPQRGPLVRRRPDLDRAIVERPRSVRALSPREGRRVVDLARECMVTRDRDLDAFAYGDPRDVRLVEYGDGLAFACIGVVPERRLLLEAVYGYLTLKNGAPIGYVLTSALYGSSEIAYNVFDTFRGAEAGPIYGRVLAMTRHLFGSDAFTIVPYQLGDGNDEAIESGAWWFYYKMGFRPRGAEVRRLVRRERARMARRPGHRSSAATLRRLAGENVFWHHGPTRDDVLGVLPLANVGLGVTRFLARRFGSARAEADASCAAEAASLLGVRSFGGWNADERRAWRRWAPLVLALPGVRRWSPAERRALARVVRAKGGRRESEFVRRFDAHPRLRRAIVRLARSSAPRD